MGLNPLAKKVHRVPYTQKTGEGREPPDEEERMEEAYQPKTPDLGSPGQKEGRTVKHVMLL